MHQVALEQQDAITVQKQSRLIAKCPSRILAALGFHVPCLASQNLGLHLNDEANLMMPARSSTAAWEPAPAAVANACWGDLSSGTYPR